MAGKDGKDAPRGKTALKTPGKDSTAKKGRQVQFESPSSSDSEGFIEEINGSSSKKSSVDSLKTGKKTSLDSLKTGGKGFFASKGDFGKEEKGYKTGKAGGKADGSIKTAKVLVETDVKLAVELPNNAEILMDCEAAAVLQGIQDYLPSLSKDPTLKMPISFNKALEHAQNGGLFTSPKSVRKVLDKLKSKGVSDGEICLIANICPETTDELYALIPSLKANKEKNEGPIRDALAKLVKLKRPI